MKTNSTHKTAGVLTCVLLAVMAGRLPAQETKPKLISAPRVMLTKTVLKQDGGTLTFQRIEPPTPDQVAALKPPLPAETPLSNTKPASILFLGAQVYEGSLTEVQWMHEGMICRAWSSLDFRMFEGVGEFEHAGIRRRLFLSSSTMTRAGFDRWARITWKPPGPRPAWPSFPAELKAEMSGRKAWYALVGFSGTAEMENAACAPLDALHDFVELNWTAFQQHQARLLTQHAAEAARRATHLEELDARPKNVIIQIWKTTAPQQQGSNKGEGAP